MSTAGRNKPTSLPAKAGVWLLGLAGLAAFVGASALAGLRGLGLEIGNGWRELWPAPAIVAHRDGDRPADRPSDKTLSDASQTDLSASISAQHSAAVEAPSLLAASTDPSASGKLATSTAADSLVGLTVREPKPAVQAAKLAARRAEVGAAPAALLAAAIKRPTRTREANGVVFSGQSDQIAAVKLQMGQLLAQMGWNSKHIFVRESADGERVEYVLQGAPDDTNTFVLAQQPHLAIGPEMVDYTDRRGKKKTLALVSQKEILAAMMQSGRAFVFSGLNCRVDALKEQVALRQNIVYWGLRADWVFPEDKIYRYNTADYWQVMAGDDWTLKPGIHVSQAVADAFVGKFAYQIGCTSACRFIFVHGILDFFQQAQPHAAALARLEQLLDKRRPFAEIAPQVDRNRIVIKDGRLMDRHLDVPWNHWVPGDWGWIKNPDEKSSEELGSEGCNIIYAGGGYFVNYYPERPPKTLDQALKRVYGWRFGLEESELNLAADLMDQLRQDPRSGGMLRDVRDFPKIFATPPQQPGA